MKDYEGNMNEYEESMKEKHGNMKENENQSEAVGNLGKCPTSRVSRSS